MPLVQSCFCPHCEHKIEQGVPVDYMPVAGASGVFVLVCPHCRKAIGAYSKPT
jgi:hypothetical protein